MKSFLYKKNVRLLSDEVLYGTLMFSNPSWINLWPTNSVAIIDGLNPSTISMHSFPSFMCWRNKFGLNVSLWINWITLSTASEPISSNKSDKWTTGSSLRTRCRVPFPRFYRRRQVGDWIRVVLCGKSSTVWRAPNERRTRRDYSESDRILSYSGQVDYFDEEDGRIVWEVCLQWRNEVWNAAVRND